MAVIGVVFVLLRVGGVNMEAPSDKSVGVCLRVDKG